MDVLLRAENQHNARYIGACHGRHIQSSEFLAEIPRTMVQLHEDWDSHFCQEVPAILTPSVPRPHR